MQENNFANWPSFTQEEANKVAEILLSNKVNYWIGNEGRSFEKEFAEFCDSDYAIAVSNGTVALDLALNGLGIGSRNGGSSSDEVIVTPRTFIASASCIVLSGAKPVFADVDRDSQNITAESIAKVLSPRSRAIICVHLAGMPCDMDAIMMLAKKHNLFVIEDCAQAHGALYKGKPVGSIGDVGCWSFCQDKIMTTGGEGGMVTTNNKSLWSFMWSYKDHGKSWEAVYEQKHPPGFRWVHNRFGTNWRLTEMQSALGRIQLQRMPQWHALRLVNAKRIWQAAASLKGLRVPAIPVWAEHAAYKCYVFVEPEQLSKGWNRDRIMNEINQRGVPCYSGSCSEVYLEKAFDAYPGDGRTWRPARRLPVAKELGETSLMFLVHPTLMSRELDLTCQVLEDVMALAISGSKDLL